MSAQPGGTRIWGAPIAIALLSAVGLLSALFADGIGNVVSWVALATPVAVIVWYVARSKRLDEPGRAIGARSGRAGRVDR